MPNLIKSNDFARRRSPHKYRPGFSCWSRRPLSYNYHRLVCAVLIIINTNLISIIQRVIGAMPTKEFMSVNSTLTLTYTEAYIGPPLYCTGGLSGTWRTVVYDLAGGFSNRCVWSPRPVKSRWGLSDMVLLLSLGLDKEISSRD